MIATLVYVHVKTENIEEFIEASIINHEASIKEDGNMRFDVLQDENNPRRFILYEAYESVEKAAKHKKTEHYLKWRKTVASYMVDQRLGVRYKGVRPLK
jgi:(4S)-4-hydroxy-5-phosphonooxypentane-2,3-dione isomerase